MHYDAVHIAFTAFSGVRAVGRQSHRGKRGRNRSVGADIAVVNLGYGGCSVLRVFRVFQSRTPASGSGVPGRSSACVWRRRPPCRTQYRAGPRAKRRARCGAHSTSRRWGGDTCRPSRWTTRAPRWCVVRACRLHTRAASASSCVPPFCYHRLDWRSRCVPPFCDHRPDWRDCSRAGNAEDAAAPHAQRN